MTRLFTLQSNGSEIEKAVKDAIDVGYRHIDTAWAYENEYSIGKAVRGKIAEGVVKRSDMFIVTKVSDLFIGIGNEGFMMILDDFIFSGPHTYN